MPTIHPTVIVAPDAEIGDGVTVGPFSIVEADVRIGDGCSIGAHVTLGEHLRLGGNVRIHNYACIGTASQDMKHKGQRSSVEIGDGAVIREYVTVNRGSTEGGVTRVGERAVLLAYVHVAHECTIGPEAVLVNAATLGGEVVIGRRAIVGGLTGIHQFCRIGEYAIVGAGSKVTQDIGPYLLADGHPARPFGPNKVGLERAGFPPDRIEQIRGIYRLLFDRAESWESNLARLEAEVPTSPLAAGVLELLRASTRGLARPRPRPSPALDELTLNNLPFWEDVVPWTA
jgi:UDP-N-acetylglucosamine acyltransferase